MTEFFSLTTFLYICPIFNQPIKVMKNKMYAAGLENSREGNWVWQGIVVAKSAKEAKRQLVEYKNRYHSPTLRARIDSQLIKMMTGGEQPYTATPAGVYADMSIVKY